MLRDKNAKKHPYDFGYFITFIMLLLLAAAAVLLLLPSYRDLRAKKQQAAKMGRELEQLQTERDQRLREVDALKNSPAAVEKVAREKYNLVGPNETVLTYPKQHTGDPAPAR